MPIIWDRQGCYWRDNDQWTATHKQIGAEPRQCTGCGDSGFGEPQSLGPLRNETVPPQRKKPLLDKGRGENSSRVHSVSAKPMPHAMMLSYMGGGHATAMQPTGGFPYQHSQSAGTHTPPPSQLDTSTDNTEREVITITKARFSCISSNRSSTHFVHHPICP